MPQARAYSRKRFLLGVPVIYASTLLRYTVSSDSERRHTRDRTQRKALRSRGLLINGHLSETFEPLLKAAAALDSIMYTADAISDLHGGLNQRERASPLFCHWEHKKSLQRGIWALAAVTCTASIWCQMPLALPPASPGARLNKPRLPGIEKKKKKEVSGSSIISRLVQNQVQVGRNLCKSSGTWSGDARLKDLRLAR